MLKINIQSVALSVIITIITTLLIKNIDLAILSILFLSGFRSIKSEKILSSVLNIYLIKDIYLEIMITSIFILLAWFVNSWISFTLYTLFYVFYLYLKRRDLVSAFRNLKLLLFSEKILVEKK